MICVIASCPLVRSMVIGDASAKAQPKKGIESNSFLATKARGGNKKLSASVSQVEECLDITTCGSLGGGMFSAPITRWRMPQIQRAATRLVPHQTMMNLKRATGGSQNTSRTSTAQIGVKTSWKSANSSERNSDIVAGAHQSSASSAVATNARSGKITVLAGKAPSRSVFSPFPERT